MSELMNKESAKTTETLPWGMPGDFNSLPVSRGKFRDDLTVLSAQTDSEAVYEWIADKGRHSPNTAQRYRREAERLLLWAAKHGKALSDLNHADFLMFQDFLSNPKPISEWVSPSRFGRNNPQWRPFIGPLSDKSKHQTLTILYSMMNFLQRKGWLRKNAMPEPDSPRKGLGFQPRTRSLSSREMDYVWQAHSQMPGDTRKELREKERIRWIIELFHRLGPRISEVSSHTMGTIQQTMIGDEASWAWFLVGKGRKEATLPLSDNLMEALGRFRISLGLNELPSPGEQNPLVPSYASMGDDGSININEARELTRSALYLIIKGLFESAALIADNHHPYDASRLRMASPHWLRHTCLRELADRTNSMRLVQELGRHSNINTSATYTGTVFSELKSVML